MAGACALGTCEQTPDKRSVTSSLLRPSKACRARIAGMDSHQVAPGTLGQDSGLTAQLEVLPLIASGTGSKEAEGKEQSYQRSKDYLLKAEKRGKGRVRKRFLGPFQGWEHHRTLFCALAGPAAAQEHMT